MSVTEMDMKIGAPGADQSRQTASGSGMGRVRVVANFEVDPGKPSGTKVSLRFAKEQPQILRLRKPQKARLSSLRMTAQLFN